MLFWQIKIETRTADNKLIRTQWLDRFHKPWDADTFIREYCKLFPEWKLTDDWNGVVRAVWRRPDGCHDYMTAYAHILFTSWEEYVTSEYRDCKAAFDANGICFDGSNI